jgi:preprotein translocase subunit SecE
MGIQQDIKRERAEEQDGEEQTAGKVVGEQAEPKPEPHPPQEDARPEHDESAEPLVTPAQLGAKRFVYAAYFAGGIGVAFIVAKALTLAWYRVQQWKPAVGEPRDEIIMPLAGIIGVAAALYYWYRTRARKLAEEVADEMSKVTWPSRNEVQNGTFVVVVTTIASTVFFALMDKFWAFVTNLVYGG